MRTGVWRLPAEPARSAINLKIQFFQCLQHGVPDLSPTAVAD